MSDAIAPTTSEVISTPERVLAYAAVVEHGQIRAPAGLPDGAQVYVLVPAVAPRPKPGTPEWERAFDEFEAYVQSHPAEFNFDDLSDDEINAIVHEVRAERHAAQGRH
jgi:hypothetical protein